MKLEHFGKKPAILWEKDSYGTTDRGYKKIGQLQLPGAKATEKTALEGFMQYVDVVSKPQYQVR